MNALLNCFPEKMLISSMLFLYMAAGNLFSATPETSKAPQKQDASTPKKGLKNFLSIECTNLLMAPLEILSVVLFLENLSFVGLYQDMFKVGQDQSV